MDAGVQHHVIVAALRQAAADGKIMCGAVIRILRQVHVIGIECAGDSAQRAGP